MQYYVHALTGGFTCDKIGDIQGHPSWILGRFRWKHPIRQAEGIVLAVARTNADPMRPAAPVTRTRGNVMTPLFISSLSALMAMPSLAYTFKRLCFLRLSR
jgi:hypothetical protein